MTYANVAATLALVFAMSGGAYAASNIIITSTKQISPCTNGKAGAVGAAGAAGAAGAKGLRVRLVKKVLLVLKAKLAKKVSRAKKVEKGRKVNLGLLAGSFRRVRPRRVCGALDRHLKRYTLLRVDLVLDSAGRTTG